MNEKLLKWGCAVAVIGICALILVIWHSLANSTDL